MCGKKAYFPSIQFEVDAKRFNFTCCQPKRIKVGFHDYSTSKDARILRWAAPLNNTTNRYRKMLPNNVWTLRINRITQKGSRQCKQFYWARIFASAHRVNRRKGSGKDVLAEQKKGSNLSHGSPTTKPSGGWLKVTKPKSVACVEVQASLMGVEK